MEVRLGGIEVHESTAWRWNQMTEKEIEAREETRGRPISLTEKKAPRG